jgi:prepilin-type processing-associated H-X9-DG protein
MRTTPPVAAQLVRPIPAGSERRAGITLLELLVVIGVVALLTGLFASAVQQARAAARMTQCQSNLRQIGIALHSYESLHGSFPPGTSQAFSWHAKLLPHIELSSLYDKIDFSDVYANTAIADVLIPLYLCPSDPSPALYRQSNGTCSHTSYLGNAGTGVQRDGYNGIFRNILIGPPPYRSGIVRAADVIDGLSNTAAVAEVLYADGSFHRLRVNWNTPLSMTAPNELDAFADYCSSIPPDPVQFGWRGDPWPHGFWWLFGNMGFNLYNHIIPPNGPSCYNRNDVQLGAFTAASAHRGGVNVLFADGRVTFLGNSISRQIWRDYGSRIEKDVQ